jgi:hypothetical protein
MLALTLEASGRLDASVDASTVAGAASVAKIQSTLPHATAAQAVRRATRAANASLTALRKR